MTDSGLTRRQLRELEAAEAARRAAAELAGAPAPSRREALQAERATIQSVEAAAPELPNGTGPIGIVPETKSVVIDTVRDITNMSLRLNDTEILITGSIELPNLAPAGTGEIKLIDTGDEADRELAEERANSDEVAIAPVPARIRQGGRRRRRVFASGLKTGRSQVYWVVGSTIIMAGMLGLLGAAWMLGLIK